MTPPMPRTASIAESASPQVVGAQARELARVRVSFDRAVAQDDPSGSSDGLNAAHYAIDAASAPAVGASVVAVEPVSSSAVDLITNTPLTPGATYRVDVAGIVEASGAGVAASNGGATFVGFVPAQPASRVFDLYRFLPELNRREDTTGHLRGFVGCLQEVTDLVLVDIDRFTDILDPDIAPERVLDRMLGELGDPFAFDLSVVDKRRLLNVLVAMYREKGTTRGIVNTIRFFLGLEVEITAYVGEALVLGESALGEDWVLGPSSLFAALAFEIVSPRILGSEERQRLRQIVEYLKPAQTHFARLVEPTPPEAIDHIELGISELGENWVLHA
jgi:phage tail-like protein